MEPEAPKTTADAAAGKQSGKGKVPAGKTAKDAGSKRAKAKAKRKKKPPKGLKVLTEGGTVPKWITFARVVMILAFAATIPTILGVKHGNRLLWTCAIAVLPLFWIVGGYHLWRRICPLAVFSLLGRFIGLGGSRRPGKWLAANYLYVQLGVLMVALSLRLVVTNGSAIWLSGFLVVATVGAIVIGFVFTGKTWCNYFCPVGFVEKVYTEPSRLMGDANSQCSPCTACKKNCPDIDLEQGYWREMEERPRRVSYYFWPGVVFAFYFYYYLVSGGWDYYFSGIWTYETDQPSRWLDPGFTFLKSIPIVAAAPLTLFAFGLASFGVFALGESIACKLALRKTTKEDQRKQKRQRIRHHTLVLSGFIAFNIFYLFGGQPTLREAPLWVVHGFSIVVVFASAAIFFRRWERDESDFVREKFARGILKRWQWDDDVGDDASLQDVYLLHNERTKQRAQALSAYKETVRDLVADGVVTKGELVILDSLRAQLGVSDKDHDKILAELSDEERQLFDPEYQGSVELRLQREQYDRDLQRAVVSAARFGRAADPSVLDSIRVEHGVPKDEHKESMQRLLAEDGPVVTLYHEELAEIDLLGTAAAAARASSDDDHVSASLAFLEYLCVWRARQHVDRALSLLATVGKRSFVDQAREKLMSDDEAQREEARLRIRAAASADLTQALLTTVAKLTESEATSFESAAFIPLANDSSHYLRAVIALLMSRFDDKASRQAVIDATDDESWLVREAAFRSLGSRGRLTRDLMAKALGDDVDRVRQAAVRAVTGTVTGEMPAQNPTQLAQTTKGIGNVGDGVYATLDASARIETLTGLEKMMLVRNVPMLRQLEPDDLEQIIDIAHEQRFKPGQDICREGEAGDNVYLLVRGEVEVYTGGQDQPKRLLSTLSGGACIGEMAVFSDAPRSATVRAMTKTRTLVLPGDEFKALLLARPAIAQSIIEQLVVRLRGLIAVPTSTGSEQPSSSS